MWKFDNNILTDKANLWQSEDDWSFSANGTLGIYIENTSKSKFLGVANDNKVNEDSPKQLWKRGLTDSEGYFSLKKSESKFLTAMSAVTLKITGTINTNKIL